jgi:hypothetical protein
MFSTDGPDPVHPTNPIGDRNVDFYRISLLGRLPEDQHDAFSPMLVKVIAGYTILLGPVEDQSALQGLLARIQSFGLELDEVKRVRSAHGVTRRLRGID